MAHQKDFSLAIGLRWPFDWYFAARYPDGHAHRQPLFRSGPISNRERCQSRSWTWNLRMARTLRQWDASEAVSRTAWDIEDAGAGFVRIKSAQTGMTQISANHVHEGLCPSLLSGRECPDPLWGIEVGPRPGEDYLLVARHWDLPDGSRRQWKAFPDFSCNGGNIRSSFFSRRWRGPQVVSDHRRDTDFRSIGPGSRYRRDADHDGRRDADHDGRRDGISAVGDKAFRGWANSYRCTALR